MQCLASGLGRAWIRNHIEAAQGKVSGLKGELGPRANLALLWVVLSGWLTLRDEIEDFRWQLTTSMLGLIVFGISDCCVFNEPQSHLGNIG